MGECTQLVCLGNSGLVIFFVAEIEGTTSYKIKSYFNGLTVINKKERKKRKNVVFCLQVAMTEAEPTVIRHFRWQDYCVFAGMLVVSSLIGVYHGWKLSRKNKEHSQDTESGACSPNGSPNASSEFLTAGGRMATWPVAISMLAR